MDTIDMAAINTTIGVRGRKATDISAPNSLLIKALLYMKKKVYNIPKNLPIGCPNILGRYSGSVSLGNLDANDSHIKLENIVIMVAIITDIHPSRPACLAIIAGIKISVVDITKIISRNIVWDTEILFLAILFTHVIYFS